MEPRAVILGCTELPMIVTEQDAELPLIDAAELHAQEAVILALE